MLMVKCMDMVLLNEKTATFMMASGITAINRDMRNIIMHKKIQFWKDSIRIINQMAMLCLNTQTNVIIKATTNIQNLLFIKYKTHLIVKQFIIFKDLYNRPIKKQNINTYKMKKKLIMWI